MTTTHPLPDLAKVMEILGLLFDGLQARPGGEFDQSAAAGAWFGVFVADDGAASALCGADIGLAASLGAAFSMLPVAMAKDAAKARELTAVMIENVREIMNICTRLVMHNGSPHLRLEQVYPVECLPPAATALLGAARGRCAFQLQLPKYGGGVLTLLSA